MNERLYNLLEELRFCLDRKVKLIERPCREAGKKLFDQLLNGMPKTECQKLDFYNSAINILCGYRNKAPINCEMYNNLDELISKFRGSSYTDSEIDGILSDISDEIKNLLAAPYSLFIKDNISRDVFSHVMIPYFAAKKYWGDKFGKDSDDYKVLLAENFYHILRLGLDSFDEKNESFKNDDVDLCITEVFNAIKYFENNYQLSDIKKLSNQNKWFVKDILESRKVLSSSNDDRSRRFDFRECFLFNVILFYIKQQLEQKNSEKIKKYISELKLCKISKNGPGEVSNAIIKQIFFFDSDLFETDFNIEECINEIASFENQGVNKEQILQLLSISKWIVENCYDEFKNLVDGILDALTKLSSKIEFDKSISSNILYIKEKIKMIEKTKTLVDSDIDLSQLPYYKLVVLNAEDKSIEINKEELKKTFGGEFDIDKLRHKSQKAYNFVVNGELLYNTYRYVKGFNDYSGVVIYWCKAVEELLNETIYEKLKSDEYYKKEYLKGKKYFTLGSFPKIFYVEKDKGRISNLKEIIDFTGSDDEFEEFSDKICKLNEDIRVSAAHTGITPANEADMCKKIIFEVPKIIKILLSLN